MPRIKRFSLPKNMLSLIVPVYRGKTIDQDLATILSYCKKHLEIPFEIICVVDGLCSQKDTTLQKARQYQQEHLSVYWYQKNKGKGYAVRFGMKKAKGNIIGFIDAGGDIHPEGVSLALKQMILHNADIVIASKRHPDSMVDYPSFRWMYSFFLPKLTAIFFHIQYSDTQTGLKLFQKKVIKKILPMLKINRWAFDLEILIASQHAGFVNIVESPVFVSYNFSSNIDLTSLVSFSTEFMVLLYHTYIARSYTS